jgi:hypothetical protein
MGDRTSLYRHFDAKGQLLYVGVSLSHVARLGQHRSKSGWYWDIAWVDVQHFETRERALYAEAIAIRDEKPLHNTMIPIPRDPDAKPAPRVVVPFRDPVQQERPRRIGYACDFPHALEARKAALRANGVTEPLLFSDVFDFACDAKPNFVRAMKYAQHEGTLFYVAVPFIMPEDCRQELAEREVILQVAA